MPFFRPANKKTGCVSLQVQKQLKKKKINSITSGKRAYLFTSGGSVTVEATISVVVFMMIMLFVESFIMMINSVMTIQININNLAMDTAKNQFYIQLADEAAKKSDTVTELKQKLENKLKGDDGVSEDVYAILEKGVSTAYLYQKLVNAIGEEALNSKLCKISNFRVNKSSISNEMIDVAVEYKISIPYINKQFKVAQRGKARAWTGKDICEEQNLVYITKDGEAYHTNKNCSHLVVKISKTDYLQIETLRNCYGEKYSPCMLCVKEKPGNDTGIFVTEDGNRYHTDLKCSGIKRNVMAVDIAQVGNRRLCSRCGQGE